MADWFKFHNDAIDEPRFQYAISEHSQVASVWLVILSEASKKRSATITWRDQDFELFGYAKKINVSVPILNTCISLLERIGYITKSDGKITINGWDELQSNYAKGVDKGYYKKTSKLLVSDSLDTSARREEKRVEEKRKDPADAVLPFSSASFESAWGSWLEHLRQKRKNPTAKAVELQLKKLAGMGESRAIATISHSIAGNWQGLFEPNSAANKPIHKKFAP